MKKLFSSFLVLVMLFSLCACGASSKTNAKKVLKEEIKTKLEQCEDVNPNTVSLKFGTISEASEGIWDLYGMIYVDDRSGSSTYSYEFYAQVKEDAVTKLETDIFNDLQ